AERGASGGGRPCCPAPRSSSCAAGTRRPRLRPRAAYRGSTACSHARRGGTARWRASCSGAAAGQVSARPSASTTVQSSHPDTLTPAPASGPSRRPRLLRLRRPVGPVLDAELLHFVELLTPERLLLLEAPPLGDLVPLLRRGVERVLGRFALGQRLGDLKGELPLVLIGSRDHRVGHQEREGRLDGVEVFVR